MTKVRLDRWLWAARFFKTRALAAAAVAGGKVHVNGTRAKPAKQLQAGDALRVRVGPYDSREAAENARQRMRSLKLVIGDATVVRQGD